MTALLLSLLCLQLAAPVLLDVEVVCTPDGAVTLSDPVTLAWPRVTLSSRDAEKVGAREWRIVEEPGPVEPAAIACGVCVVGRYWGPPGKTKACYAAPAGPLCMRCGVPCPLDPVPIARMRLELQEILAANRARFEACGEPPSGGRIGR